jgi:hypothetical protein
MCKSSDAMENLEGHELPLKLNHHHEITKLQSTNSGQAGKHNHRNMFNE